MRKFNFFLSLATLGLILSSCGGGDAPSGPTDPSGPTHEHSWGTPTYNWGEGTCEGVVVCLTDESHKIREDASVSSSVLEAATESSVGTGLWTATFTNSVFTTQTKEYEIPMLEHTHTYSDAWTYDDNYHWHKSTCGHDVVSGKAEHVFTSSVVDGVTTYTCICGASYTVGSYSMLEYEDNDELPETVNHALKTLFSSGNFTMEDRQEFDNQAILVVNNTDEPPVPPYTYEQLEQQLADLVNAGIFSAEYADQMLQEYIATYLSTGVGPLHLYINGDISETIRFVNKDYAYTTGFTGEMYLSLSELLAFCEKESWSFLINDQNSKTKVTSAFSRSELASDYYYRYFYDFKWSDFTVDGDKVIVSGTKTQYAYEFFDERLGQYYIKSNQYKSGYRYIVPDNNEFQYIDLMYSVLEQLIYYASIDFVNTESNPLVYDESTLSYDREYWGSGSSRFDFRNLCPIVLNYNANVVSLNNKLVKNIGTTVIDEDRSVPVCEHTHGYSEYWFNEEVHADFCKDCGRAVVKHPHNILNEHDYCVDCCEFAAPMFLETYKYVPEYDVGDLFFNAKINPNTGKKYLLGYGAAGIDDVVGGIDVGGKFYGQYSERPATKEEICIVSEDVDLENLESLLITEESCVYVTSNQVVKKTYTCEYDQLTTDAIIAAGENVEAFIEKFGPGPLYDYYYCITDLVSEVVIDTLYDSPFTYHMADFITSNDYKVVSFEEVLQYTRTYDYQYSYYLNKGADMSKFKFVVLKCENCDTYITACLSQPEGAYVSTNLFDAHGNLTGRYEIKYTWLEDYSMCRAEFIIKYPFEDVLEPVTLIQETVTSEHNESSYMYTASFNNQVFETQTELYYGE